MKLLTGLFRATKKRLLTTDNDLGAFRTQLNELVQKKDSLEAADVDGKVEALKKICEDLPEDEEKAKLLRFLEDFKSVKEQDAEVAKEAARAVADLFEKLDAEAMSDAPAVEVAAEEGTTEAEATAEGEVVETKEETSEEAPAVDEATETTEEIAEATEEAEDEDPNPNYSLEEIYQFIKKRMSEDAACETEEGDENGEKSEVIEEEKIIGDSAPVIPVTLNNAARGGLDALFAACKGE